jgi:hypothetical protein
VNLPAAIVFAVDMPARQSAQEREIEIGRPARLYIDYHQKSMGGEGICGNSFKAIFPA